MQHCCKYSFKALIFPEIGKKNNQSSVSDADQTIPTLGSTDNAENSVNLGFGIIHVQCSSLAVLEGRCALPAKFCALPHFLFRPAQKPTCLRIFGVL